MSTENEKEGINPASETRSDVHRYDEDPDLVQLLVRLGVDDNDQYLTNARIEEIASSDADEEKRQLAARLLQLQLYVKSIMAIRAYGFKHKPGGDNILNPLDPLDESHLVSFSDLLGHSGTAGSGE